MNSDMTYGGLDAALHELGFVSFTGTNSFGLPFLSYENDTHDAVIVIPALPMNEPLHPGHLTVAEKTVEGKGVADISTLDDMIRKASHSEVHAA